MKETCILCGMVANVDPWTHQERYRHVPKVIRDGVVHIHNGRGAFIPEEPKR
jgi:hypothetical protein